MYSCARYVNRPYSIATGTARHPDVHSILRSKTVVRASGCEQCIALPAGLWRGGAADRDRAVRSLFRT